jgi:energy-coupling factor transporter ATP-binding protein EcfA2
VLGQVEEAGRRLVADIPGVEIAEPTNHLDAQTIEWLEGYLLEQYSGAVVLITHDRYLLDRVVTRMIEVAEGEIYSYQGGYEQYLEQKARRLEHAARAEQNRQNLLRRELEWLRRQPKARTTKQKARIERAEPNDRQQLERALRYCARPPISDDRLELLPDGRIRLTLKTPYSDGTTHLALEPQELLEKLVALIPRPRVNLLLYRGILTP